MISSVENRILARIHVVETLIMNRGALNKTTVEIHPGLHPVVVEYLGYDPTDLYSDPFQNLVCEILPLDTPYPARPEDMILISSHSEQDRRVIARITQKMGQWIAQDEPDEPTPQSKPAKKQERTPVYTQAKTPAGYSQAVVENRKKTVYCGDTGSELCVVCGQFSGPADPECPTCGSTFERSLLNRGNQLYTFYVGRKGVK